MCMYGSCAFDNCSAQLALPLSPLLLLPFFLTGVGSHLGLMSWWGFALLAAANISMLLFLGGCVCKILYTLHDDGLH